MPPADAAVPGALLRGSGFGRTALNPAGMTACEGNFGVGICPATPTAVAIGDLDGGGRPDLVVGAPQLTENPLTAQPGSHCAARPPGTVCEQAGRACIYRGEDIAASNPATILDGTGPGQSIRTIKNPDAQGDATTGVPAPVPPPPPPPDAAPAGPAGPAGESAVPTLAGRTIELAASAASLRTGRPLTLKVRLEAFADLAGCQVRQLVALQRRRPNSVTFNTFASRGTSSGGTLSLRTRPKATYVYRAGVAQTARCTGAVSNRERVTLRR